MARLGLRLDAIVGLDVLGHQNLTIDYREREIRFGASSANGQAVPFGLQTEAGAPYVVVPLEIDSHAVRLLLDTGTDGLTLFAARLQGRMPTLKNAGALEDVNAGGAYASRNSARHSATTPRTPKSSRRFLAAVIACSP